MWRIKSAYGISRLVFLALFSGALCVCFAQTATLNHGSNLRKSPSTSSTILETLSQGDTVTLTSGRKRHRYYHVQASDGTQGWVLAKNVSTSGTGPTPPNQGGGPSQPDHGGAAPATGLVGQLEAAAVAAVPQPLVINGRTVCGPTGDASNSAAVALDTNKNRTDVPQAGTYITVGWNDLANLPSDQSDHLQGAPVEVEGYLSHAIKVENSGSGESTNCHLLNDDEVDWHMYLTPQPAQGIAQAIIVETTPRTRPLHSWDKSTLDGLVDSNTKVRIGGWLMYDTQHVGAIGTQRATVWEVHPITRIETQDNNGGWKDVEGH